MGSLPATKIQQSWVRRTFFRVFTNRAAFLLRSTFTAKILIDLRITVTVDIPKIAYTDLALAATLHDILAILAVFFITGVKINLLFITAVFTITGYPLTDTIVIFDRTREKPANGLKYPI